MRYAVTGSADDALAGEALIQELTSRGLSVVPTYRALESLDELAQEAARISSSDSLLLLVSNASTSFIRSLARLDELLSFRRSGTQIVRCVLLDEADAGPVDIVRVAQRRGARRRQDIVTELLAEVASITRPTTSIFDDNEYWIAYSYWRMPAYTRALLILAIGLFALAATWPLEKIAVLVFVAVVVVILVVDIQWIRPARLRRWQRSFHVSAADQENQAARMRRESAHLEKKPIRRRS